MRWGGRIPPAAITPLTFYFFYFFWQAFRMASGKIEYYSGRMRLNDEFAESQKRHAQQIFYHSLYYCIHTYKLNLLTRSLVFIATVNSFAFFDNPPKLHQLLPTRRGRFLYNTIKPFEHRNIITLLSAENMMERCGCQP